MVVKMELLVWGKIYRCAVLYGGVACLLKRHEGGVRKREAWWKNAEYAGEENEMGGLCWDGLGWCGAGWSGLDGWRWLAICFVI